MANTPGQWIARKMSADFDLDEHGDLDIIIWDALKGHDVGLRGLKISKSQREALLELHEEILEVEHQQMVRWSRV